MPMQKLLLLIYLTFSLQGLAQNIVYRNQKDTTQNFYKIALPESKPKGVIVIPYNFMGNPKLATDNGLAVVEITPSKNYIENRVSL
jgi:hypothetical protein